ncbi:MAG: cysteine dioxygenase family protein [Proteobacteria bacterium]|nr:cysteine dioxygenase family protein [Pseudomonadota bacterium]
MSVAEQRRQAVAETIGRIRRIEAEHGVTRAALDRIKAALLDLAARDELFPLADFPPPKGKGDTGNRYLLSEDPDRRFALYLNSLLPGKKTNPHDHTTWAVVVAVDGEEINRVYERTDDRRAEGKASLRQVKEVVVRPGAGIALMPEDIHAIEVTGSRPTRHLHMYGRALETLDRRVGYDLETGTYVPYNKTQMKPSLRTS